MYDIERGGQAEHGLGQGTGLGQGSAQEQGLGQVYYVPSAHSMSGVNQPAWIVAFNPHDKVTNPTYRSYIILYYDRIRQSNGSSLSIHTTR